MQRNKCIINSCQATLKRYPNRRFFQFPKANTEKFLKWKKVLEMSGVNIEGHKKPYICNLHFESKFFGKKKLKDCAYPSLHLTYNSEIQNDEESGFDPSKVVRTYESHSSKISEDIDIEELNQASLVLPSKASEEDAISHACSQCEKSLKRNKYYMRVVQNIKSRLKELMREKNQLTKKNKIQKNKILRLQNRNKNIKNLKYVCIDESIDLLENVNNNSKTFAKMILFRKAAYSEEEKILSQCIYFRSSSGYKFLREVLGFRLPCISSLHNWIQIKSLSPGFHENVLKEIAPQVLKLNERERNVVLLFDEMSVKENLTYNKYKDLIEGFVDYGDGERENKHAKSICVFMVRSICGKFKQILDYLACPGTIPSDILNKHVRKCIDVCEKMNLIVRLTSCDQGPTNRKFYRINNVTSETPYFSHNGKKIYCSYDVPHLFKSIRNNLKKGDLMTPDGQISWKIIEILYNVERNETTKMCPKLTSVHVYPTEFQKMSVRLAVQVLSHSVANGIRALLALDKFESTLKEIALSTAKFIERMNKLFDFLNGKPTLTREFDSSSYIAEMKSYVVNIKPVVGKDMALCFKGLNLTLSSVEVISHSLFENYCDLHYIHMKKINQDPLENLFSQIRSRNANKNNPSVFEFSSIFAKILSIKLLFSSKFSNCETDDDETIEIDWKAVFEISHVLDNSGNPNEELSNSMQLHEEENFLEENIPNTTQKVISPSDVGARYFAGYCYLKTIKQFQQPCAKCSLEMTQGHSLNTDLSTILIQLKQYTCNNISDTSGLISPSEIFYCASLKQINIFTRIFNEKPHITAIRKFMLDTCINLQNEWFCPLDACFNHRINILHFMLLVLLRKNCKWVMDTKVLKTAPKTKNKKLSNLMNL